MPQQLEQILDDQGDLQNIGGLSYIVETRQIAFLQVPNAEYYAKNCRRKGDVA